MLQKLALALSGYEIIHCSLANIIALINLSKNSLFIKEHDQALKDHIFLQ